MSNEGTGTDVVSAGDRAVTQPADRAVGYGQKAVDQGTTAAEAPAQTTTPAHILLAEKALALFAAENPLLRNVKIRDYAEVPSSVIRNSAGLFSAWTNSANAIYVYENVDGKYLADYVMFHESRHVMQFAKYGGPPTSYVQMLRHECEAYGDTAAYMELMIKIRTNVPGPYQVGLPWADVATLVKWRDESKNAQQWFAESIVEAGEPVHSADPEAFVLEELTAAGYLPQEVRTNNLPVTSLYVRS